jgi:hypothetical protein
VSAMCHLWFQCCGASRSRLVALQCTKPAERSYVCASFLILMGQSDFWVVSNNMLKVGELELAGAATSSCAFRRPLNSAQLHWSSTEMQNRFYATSLLLYYFTNMICHIRQGRMRIRQRTMRRPKPAQRPLCPR